MALDRSRRLGSVPYGVGLLGPAPHHVRYPVYVAAPRCFPLPLPGLSVPGRGLSCRYPLLATWLRYLLPLSLVLSLRRSPSSPSSLVPLLSTFAVLVLSSLWPASWWSSYWQPDWAYNILSWNEKIFNSIKNSHQHLKRPKISNPFNAIARKYDLRKYCRHRHAFPADHPAF